jgi:hypothetical protein
LNLRNRLAIALLRTRIARWLSRRARIGEFNRLAGFGFLLLIFLFMAGLLSAVLEGSRLGAGLSIILRSRLAQTLYEVFINVSVLTMGTVGVYLWYVGARKVTGSREVSLYFLLGTFLILIATSLAIFLLFEKGFL